MRKSGLRFSASAMGLGVDLLQIIHQYLRIPFEGSRYDPRVDLLDQGDQEVRVIVDGLGHDPRRDRGDGAREQLAVADYRAGDPTEHLKDHAYHLAVGDFRRRLIYRAARANEQLLELLV
jgi:hypothetical protein